MKRAIFFFAIVSVISSCYDDDGMPMPPVVTCAQGLDEFAETATEIDDPTFRACGDTCIVDCEELYSSAIPYDYTTPCFNPNNGDQLVYYRFDNTAFNAGSEIWVADFCKNEKKMIVNNALYGLDWSVRDWLVYTADDQNIWKVKSNGDSLTQVTFVGDYNRYPKWSPDGGRIAFNAEIQGSQYFFIAESNGNVIDTLDELSFSRAWTWIDEDRIGFVTGMYNGSITTQTIKIINIQSDSVNLLNNLIMEHDSLLLSISPLLSENSIALCALGFIGMTNLETGEFKILKKSLTQEGYWNFSIRPSENEILINKSIIHSVPGCKYDSDWGFYLVNKDGSNTRKINLPQ